MFIANQNNYTINTLDAQEKNRLAVRIKRKMTEISVDFRLGAGKTDFKTKMRICICMPERCRCAEFVSFEISERKNHEKKHNRYNMERLGTNVREIEKV